MTQDGISARPAPSSADPGPFPVGAARGVLGRVSGRIYRLRTACRSRRGLTLIEIAIVVAIIGVLAAIGFGSIREALPRYRTRQAALQFAGEVDRLRTLAIMNNRYYRVWLVEYDDAPTNPGTNSVGRYMLQALHPNGVWDTLPVDADVDGSDDATAEGDVWFAKGGNKDDEIPDVSILQWDTIGGPTFGARSASNENCIVFSPRGWLKNPDSDLADGFIHVDFINREAAVQGKSDEVYRVSVYRSGFARVDYLPETRFASVAANAIGVNEASRATNDFAAGSSSGAE